MFSYHRQVISMCVSHCSVIFNRPETNIPSKYVGLSLRWESLRNQDWAKKKIIWMEKKTHITKVVGLSFLMCCCLQLYCLQLCCTSSLSFYMHGWNKKSTLLDNVFFREGLMMREGDRGEREREYLMRS